MKKAIAAGLVLALAPLAAATAQNWDATAVATSGGHRTGNPQAATSLVAFVSYSCPHCAEFELQSDAAIRAGYIQPGKISYEVRPVMRSPIDIAATLAVECGGEDKFWGNHRAMLRSQSRWLPILSSSSPAQQARWTSGTFGSRMRAIASDLGFYQIMAGRGYSAPELDQCLNNQAAARLLAASSQADAERWNIAGTPSFVLNGQLQQGVFTWAALSPLLAAATR